MTFAGTCRCKKAARPHETVLCFVLPRVFGVCACVLLCCVSLRRSVLLVSFRCSCRFAGFAAWRQFCCFVVVFGALLSSLVSLLRFPTRCFCFACRFRVVLQAACTHRSPRCLHPEATSSSRACRDSRCCCLSSRMCGKSSSCDGKA